MDDREFYKLETIVQVTREDCARHSAEIKELTSLISRLEGQVLVLSEHEQIHEQFRQIQTRFTQLQTDNTRQSQQIGKLYGIVQMMASAMSQSQDKGLATAAKGITINVNSGDNNIDSVTNNGGTNTITGDVT